LFKSYDAFKVEGCVQSGSLLGATCSLVVTTFDNLSKAFASFSGRDISSLGVTMFDNLSKAVVSLCQPLSAFVSLCQPLSAIVSLFQPFSAFVSLC
jgi:hypothetical protein